MTDNQENRLNLLKRQIDKLVVPYKSTNSSFYNGYFSAREIIDLGSTTGKVRGVVTRQGSGDPLSNVKFSIFEKGTTTLVKFANTDAEGKFRASNLPPGDFDFRWEIPGYKTINETNVHLSAGKELKRKIVMQPGGMSLTRQADVPAGTIANVPVN